MSPDIRTYCKGAEIKKFGNVIGIANYVSEIENSEIGLTIYEH